MQLLQDLKQLPVPVFLSGVSAMRHYLGLPLAPMTTLTLAGDLVTVARNFAEPQFCSVPGVDAVVEHPDTTMLIRCAEQPPSPDAGTTPASSISSWHYSPHSSTYIDQASVYKQLRGGELKTEIASADDAVHAALALAQLPLQPSNPLRHPPAIMSGEIGPHELSRDAQRILLEGILGGEQARTALEHLHDWGWIRAFWPQLAEMDATEQGKSEHPEGNVWQHSLEALTHRKTLDIRVGLAVLLHDSGKPYARQTARHRFHLHADIGADLASRLLGSLGFPPDIIRDVCWLIRHHSFPGALAKLPQHRTAPLMANPLFPLLLELYRCDLSATFRGPEGYYSACTVYRRFLKYEKNPFRDPAGKKLLNSLVE
ncbi:HD domain-containing protein [Spirochaeta africana]|uniref:Putative HD superfamily hydrolase n=1 Tax=Spirochaeta africana (strain ATCC 700263 / DSM 8902 / Z-7692) TaxID=889378 RepID=H9UMP3_SPIAZ|nr:HD domain-containing protein [Spirochaeta africana]AFG38786.1 putative HD superfamily hydrolase [Spirochaeta africana DSM 8902]